MLATVVVLAGVAAVLMAGASAALATMVDRRWPADEPMSPAELLWGEVGGHVQKTFPGLDPEIAVDLSPYLRTLSVPAGQAIVEAGDPATDFFVITKGQAAVDDGPPSGPGDGVGGDAILGGGVHHETVVATRDCTLLALPAEDYVAAVTLSARTGDDDDPGLAVAHRMAGGEAPAVSVPEPPPAPPEGGAEVVAEAATEVVEPPPPPPQDDAPGVDEPSPAPDREPRQALVVVLELPGFVLPGGDAPTTILDEGMQVTVLESLAGWSHVRTRSGWQGWVEDTGLEMIEEADR